MYFDVDECCVGRSALVFGAGVVGDLAETVADAVVNLVVLIGLVA